MKVQGIYWVNQKWRKFLDVRNNVNMKTMLRYIVLTSYDKIPSIVPLITSQRIIYTQQREEYFYTLLLWLYYGDWKLITSSPPSVDNYVCIR